MKGGSEPAGGERPDSGKVDAHTITATTGWRETVTLGGEDSPSSLPWQQLLDHHLGNLLHVFGCFLPGMPPSSRPPSIQARAPSVVSENSMDNLNFVCWAAESKWARALRGLAAARELGAHRVFVHLFRGHYTRLATHLRRVRQAQGRRRTSCPGPPFESQFPPQRNNESLLYSSAEIVRRATGLAWPAVDRVGLPARKPREFEMEGRKPKDGVCACSEGFS